VCRLCRHDPPLIDWTEAAKAEPDHFKELEAKF